MAGHGGGAWKVAYADFVTAMMAFFLVMWIVAQDQKLKEAIAHYFVTPMGYVPIGERTRSPAGGVFENLGAGDLPMSEAAALGRGRTPHSDISGSGRITKIVSDWVHAEPEDYNYWKGHANRIRAAAERLSPNGKNSPEVERAAAERLAQILSAEMHDRIPRSEAGLFRDLLIESLAEVNWEEIAEDLINE